MCEVECKKHVAGYCQMVCPINSIDRQYRTCKDLLDLHNKAARYKQTLIKIVAQSSGHAMFEPKLMSAEWVTKVIDEVLEEEEE